jgi:hypothetical protein
VFDIKNDEAMTVKNDDDEEVENHKMMMKKESW